MITKLLSSIQLVTSVLLILFILLQAKGTGLGAGFGGEGNIYRTKRGLEKGLFIVTIITAVVWAGSALLYLIIS